MSTCQRLAVLFGVSVASVVKWVAALASGSGRCIQAKPMGGERPLELKGERAWLLARISREAGPDLAGGGGRVGQARHAGQLYGAGWRFFQHQGITFKKNAARQRTRSRRHRPPPRTRWKTHQRRLDPAPGIHRRDLGQDQYDPPARALPPRRAPGRQGAARPLANTATFLAALRHDRITAPCIIKRQINGRELSGRVEIFLGAHSQTR